VDIIEGHANLFPSPEKLISPAGNALKIAQNSVFHHYADVRKRTARQIVLRIGSGLKQLRTSGANANGKVSFEKFSSETLSGCSEKYILKGFSAQIAKLSGAIVVLAITGYCHIGINADVVFRFPL